MSINYNSIIGARHKVTLPSVSSGLGSLYIEKDPPKSITTRRIVKVGETSRITEEMDASGDRYSEMITEYARGVNPMVSVSYGNHGNGTGSGSITSTSMRAQPRMPYRIMDQGAFRPPVRLEKDLLPLSRLPIQTISLEGKAGYADYTKKLMCPQDCTKTAGVKNSMRTLSVKPTAVYKLDFGVNKPSNVKYVIQNPVRVSANSGKRTMDGTKTIVKVPTKEIAEKYTRVHAISNKNQNIQTKENFTTMDTDRFVKEYLTKDVSSNPRQYKHVKENYVNMETDRYVKDSLTKDVTSNPRQYRHVKENFATMDTDRYTHDQLLQAEINSNISKNINTTDIRHILDGPVPVRDSVNISYDTIKTGYEKNEYIHKRQNLKRNVPVGEMHTNQRKNIHIQRNAPMVRQMTRNRPMVSMVPDSYSKQRSNDTYMNRERILKPTLTFGGMDGRVTKPLQSRQGYKEKRMSDKDIMRKKVFDMQMGRGGKWPNRE